MALRPVASFLVLLAACPGSAQTSSSSSALTGPSPTGCVSPLAYGATVGDTTDDRAAIQAAIDAACAERRSVCLPAGDLYATRRYGTGAANAWSLQVTCDGLLIEGEGDVSRIRMLGSAAVPPMTSPGDWWLLKVQGTNVTLRNFMLDGATRSQPTSEQTHLIKLLGPDSGTTIEDFRLNLPDRGDSTGGDCIQAGGEEATPVRGVVIDKVRADECDRSFIGLQRWVSELAITSSRSWIVGDQALDMEPTGIGTIGRVSIRDSHFGRNGRGDGVAVTITGGAGGAPPGYETIIEGGSIDGSILIYDSARVTLRDFSIVSSGPEPTIWAKKRSADILIDHLYVEHKGSYAQHAISFGLHTSSWPTNATVRASHIVQRSPGDAIHGEPIVGLTVQDNRIECLGPVEGYAAVGVRSVAAVVDDIKVRSNVVSGNCRYLLRASATATFGIGATTATDNTIRGASYGVVYENAAPLVKPVIDGNTFNALNSSSFVVGAGAAGFVGAN